MEVDGAAGTLGRSDAFLTSSKCPSPSCRDQGCQEAAKDGVCLMRTEEETGKGLPWPPRGSGTFLTWSCCVLAAGDVAEGGSVGPGGPTPPGCACSARLVGSWARGSCWVSREICSSGIKAYPHSWFSRPSSPLVDRGHCRLRPGGSCVLEVEPLLVK